MSTDRESWGASPAAARDLILIGVMVAGLAGVLVAAGVLAMGLGIASALLGGRWVVPPPGQWLGLGWSAITHAEDPAGAAGVQWAAAAGHPGLYWGASAAMAMVVVVIVTTAAIAGWRQWGPTPPGHASRAQVRAELSPAAARRTAAWTRPGLSTIDRRAAALTEIAAPLHRGPIGPMWSPFENPTGSQAPTQSGKTRTDLVHKALDAPGALLCSTTKPDLVEFAGLARTRRSQAGPVLVFDATGSVEWPARVAWNPIDGCTDLGTAYRRARTMVEAAAVGLVGEAAGNDKVFRERATFVLATYLIAAAASRRSMTDIVEWATGSPPSSEPVGLLADHFPELGKNLAAEMGMVSETSDAVWLAVRRVVEPLLDPALLSLCTPPPGTGFDARAHIGKEGSLFIIAGEHQARQVTPLLTALVEHWLTTAQEMALSYPTRRLDPPATAVIDELCNGTPLLQLPDIISDSAGRGVVIHWSAQSLGQLENTFGAARARQLLDNTTTLTVWGALKDARALEWVSTLAGHHDRTRYQDHVDGAFSPNRSSIGTETVPTFRPGQVRTLPRGRVLVLHRMLPPILARTVDVTERPDWPQLRVDVEDVRAGRVRLDGKGYALALPPVTQ